MALTRTVMFSYLCTAPVFWTLSFTVPSMLRAMGDAAFPMRVSIASMFVTRVLISWVLGVYLGWGILGVWIAMYLDWVVRTAFFTPRMLKAGKKQMMREAAAENTHENQA